VLAHFLKSSSVSKPLKLLSGWVSLDSMECVHHVGLDMGVLSGPA
jgi:hypothetical protein